MSKFKDKNIGVSVVDSSRTSNLLAEDFARFDKFLNSKNINLQEFYNYLFQKFFYHGVFVGFDFCGRESVLRRKTNDECFEMRVRLQSTEEFPHTDDRDYFYAIINSLKRSTKNSLNQDFVKDFRLSLPLRRMREMQGWLKRVSSITAEVEFATFESAEISQTLRIENLRLIEDYAISEIDDAGFFGVQIGFAEWLRHGFTTKLLDRGIFYLVKNGSDSSYRHF